MKDIIIIYDDSRKPNQEIRSITGEKTFGDTIFKRVTLKERMKQELLRFSHIRSFMTYQKAENFNNVSLSAVAAGNTCSVLHLFSDCGLRNREALKVLLEKAGFINENFVAMCDDKIALAMFADVSAYLDFLNRNVLSGEQETVSDALETVQFEKISTEAFVDLSNINHFRQFITGGFDARFFNVLAGDEFTVTKQSENKKKIKREFEYYYLLPENMKMWYVMPFHYVEDEQKASYMMERYHMTDIAIRYVHGAITQDEFRDILDKLFYFLKNRKEKEVPHEIYAENANELYLKKVENRIEQLKQLKSFEKLNRMIQTGTEFEGMDDIIIWYRKIYDAIVSKKSFRNVLVVGHGDLCFSNILYSREASLLKLIDPRGALSEEELYMNPYYDMAKLSHSICGYYDFFNSDLFEISLEDGLQYKLTVLGEADNAVYRNIFMEYLEQYGVDYALIRLYEASLFLSMLPLHIDREKKVFGFILNAIRILKEIEPK